MYSLAFCAQQVIEYIKAGEFENGIKIINNSVRLRSPRQQCLNINSPIKKQLFSRKIIQMNRDSSSSKF